MQAPEQEVTTRYFADYQSYRSPQHPVVEAFVTPKIHLVERFVNLSSAGCLLDVGCGNGIFTHYLRRRCKCIGVDISWEMLQRAEGFPAVQAEAACLPFAANAFDVVFCANLLHHLPHPEQALEEMARVSASWVIIVEPNAANPPMWLFGLLRRAERGTLRSSRGYLRDLVESAGLEIMFLHSTGMITQNLTPQWMIPFLRPFDRLSPFGAYTVVVARWREHNSKYSE